MLALLLRAMAWIPLVWLHGLGVVCGWLMYLAWPAYAQRLRNNLRSSGLCPDQDAFRCLLREIIAETGKGVLELIAIWFRPKAAVDRLVVDCQGWQLVEAALLRGKSIIFLGPHIGCFALAALYVGSRIPLTVMYRPWKQKWLEPLMLAAHHRWNINMVVADIGGVRKAYESLESGKALGLMPDQVPTLGSGKWAEFLGRPAYTVTLPTRLQQKFDIPVIAVFAERLRHGQGYRLYLEEVATDRFDETQLNQVVEKLVRRCPAQYLWSYNRYKTMSSRRFRQSYASRRAKR